MSIIDAVRGLVGGEDPAASAVRALPFEVLQVLRAGSLIGRPFTAEAVAALLGLTPLAVLERLQQASDADVPVADGEGGFSLPKAWQAALAGSLLPSLARAWRGRLGGAASDGASAASAEAATSAGGEVSAGTGDGGAAGAGKVVEGTGAAVGKAEEKVDPKAEEQVSEGAGVADEKVTEGTGSAEGAEKGAGGTVPAGEKGEERVAGGTGSAKGKGEERVAGGTGAAGEKGEERVAGGTGAAEGEERVAGGTGAAEGAERVAGGTGAAEVAGGTGAAEVAGGAGSADRGAGRGSEGTMEIDAAMLMVETIAVERRAGGAPPPPPSGTEGTMEIDVAMFVRTTPTEAGKAATVGPRPPPPSRSARREVVMPRLQDTGMGSLNLDFLAAAQEAVERGEPQVGAEHLQRALGELAAQSPAHIRLRILGLIALAKVQWKAAGAEHGFTLLEALNTLDAARAELGSDAPSDLAAELCQTSAGVCLDIGDMPSLERALAELAVASRLFEAAGDTVRVQKLLNERAAVLVLLGDAGQASTMLRESRKAFEGREDDPTAQREIAETDHMMAWLSLYAQLRPGRELDGLRMGIEHAKTAEKIFRRLEDWRELARAQETMGRLALRVELPAVAIEHLEPAVRTQRQIGDLIGLGRSTDALAQALSLVGREGEAIALLAESIAVNREKCSPLGMAFNRQTFTNFAVRFGTTQHGAALHEVGLLLARCERELDVLRRQAAR